MPEVSIKNQIQKLVELQVIDLEVYNFKTELKERPEQLEVIKNQFESKKAHLHELEEKLKVMVVDRKTQEGEIKDKEAQIAKDNTQLSQLKTNKEYQAKITEIEGHKADISIVEDKVLASYDQADEVNTEIEKEKSVLAQEEKKYLEQKKDVEEAIQKIGDDIKSLENKRQQILPEIDPTHLTHYEKILNKKDGIAIVPVSGDSCGGCYMNVTAQTINEIKMNDKLICCEMCIRILYIEEDL